MAPKLRPRGRFPPLPQNPVTDFSHFFSFPFQRLRLPTPSSLQCVPYSGAGPRKRNLAGMTLAVSPLSATGLVEHRTEPWPSGRGPAEGHGSSYFPVRNTLAARGGGCHQFRSYEVSTSCGGIRSRNWLTVPSHLSGSPFLHWRVASSPRGQSFLAQPRHLRHSLF